MALSSCFWGFLSVHFLRAKTSWGNSYSCQSSLVLTRSPLMPSNLSIVILTYLEISLSFPKVSNACTFDNNFVKIMYLRWLTSRDVR